MFQTVWTYEPKHCNSGLENVVTILLSIKLVSESSVIFWVVNCGQSAEKDFEKESSVTNSLFFRKKFSKLFF
jgi:hypothetical protein